MKMTKFWFTFGFGQAHENHYHIIEASNPTEARVEMCNKFGNKWAMMYDSAEAAGVEEFNLTELK